MVIPILFVKKKSSELRICSSYHQPNKIAIEDHYPLTTEALMCSFSIAKA